VARHYLTTAIPYVNARPHLGFALELVQADAFARYRRLRGDDIRFLTGTDENSLSNVLAAERAGKPVRVFVEEHAGVFAELAARLGISNDDFIRTATDPRHLAGATALWRACAANGDIYTQSYRGLYCVGCELFYDDEELVDGRCPEHGTVPEIVEEENFFFRLSRYQGALEELLDSGRLRVLPAHRHAEARAFVGRGLRDFSISRSLTRARGWGIPVPDDPSQVMYVWFDALTNYISALGYGSPQNELYRRYWLESPARVHAIGKGILRFHAIYWPAMLLSAAQPPPTEVFVHGYLTRDGRKLSKSLGNTIDPFELVDAWGAEAVRYWLLAEVPATEDADYTDERFERAYVGALANDLGNLLNRTVSMLHRYRGGIVPSVVSAPPSLAAAASLGTELQRAFGEELDPREAMRAVWELVGAANRYVEESAPWTLAQAGDAASLDAVLYALLEALRLIGQALRPLLPGTAERVLWQLGVSVGDEVWMDELAWGRLPAGTIVAQPKVLFPKDSPPTVQGREPQITPRG